MPKIIIVIIIAFFLTSLNALADKEMDSSNGGGSIRQSNSDIILFNEWDDNDKILFTTSELLLIADWGQSLDINRRGATDLNPILNHAPESTVNIYFACWVVGNYFITDNLSGYYRKLWLFGLTQFEIVVVGTNFSAGWNVRF